MSLNITQAMSFETDHLESFQEMLLAAVLAMFKPKCGDKPVGVKQPMYLEKKDPGYWSDGKDYNHASQPPFLHLRHHQGGEEGKECRVLAKDGVFHGAKRLRFDSQPCSAEEAAAACCKQRRELGPTRRWVATLRDEAYNEEDLPEKDKIYCRGPNDAVAKVLVFLRQDENVSLKDIRNVHEDGDGSYGLAYRMEGSAWGGGGAIYVSATWAYYGK